MEENQNIAQTGKKDTSKRNGTICLFTGLGVWLFKMIVKRVVFFRASSYEVFDKLNTLSLVCNIVMAICVVLSIIFYARDPVAVKKRREGEAFTESKEELILAGIIALIGFAVAAILVLVLKVSLYDDVYGDIMFFGIPIGGLIYIIKEEIITDIFELIKRGAVFVHNFAVFFFAVPYIGIALGVLAWGFFMLLYVGVCIGAFLGVLYSFIFVFLLKVVTFVLCLVGIQVPGKVIKWVELIGTIIAAVLLGGTVFFALAGALL